MGRLDGKVAVITGATSGIGLHTAEIFVAEGAKIIIAGRRAPEGEALAKKLGPNCIFRQTDVTVEEQIKALIALSVEKLGRIDCLFNNAGGPAQTGGIEGLEVERFDAAMATLVRSVMLGMSWAYADKPEMTAQLAEAYTVAGNANNALVIPAGLAFARAIGKQPELNLYAIDKRHPSAAGTYLASCVVFAALTGRSPAGNSYHANIDPPTAAFLQNVAWETVQEYYGK